jgi:hypothetical protein
MAVSDPKTLSPPAEPAAPLPRDTNRWRRRIVRLLGGIPVAFAILLLASVTLALFITRWDTWVGASVRQSTDDAYVRSDITPLSAKIEGDHRTDNPLTRLDHEQSWVVTGQAQREFDVARCLQNNSLRQV